MLVPAAGVVLVAAAVAATAYITFVVVYWQVTDDPAAPVGTTRNQP